MLIDCFVFQPCTIEHINFFTEKNDSSNTLIDGFIINDFSELHSFYSCIQFFFKSEQKFCLAFTSSFLEEIKDENFSNELSDVLAPLIFHINYYKKRGIPFVVIKLEGQKRYATNELAVTLVSKIKRIIAGFGYDEINYSVIDCHNKEVITNLPGINDLFCSSEADLDGKGFIRLYDKTLSTKLFSKMTLFFFNEKVIGLTEIENDITKIEELFKNNEPELYQMYNENRDLQNKTEAFEIAIRVLKDNLAAREFYIKTSHPVDASVKKINNFYYYEYEILPSWYKKFGHIIKVLMGKRTMNSLFNDNVKKYKD